VLIPEMLSLEAERKAKNKVIVQAPGREGAHDDISDAFVRAVWMCYRGHKGRTPHITTGAGGHTGAITTARFGPPEMHVQQVSQKEFFMQRRKKHGEHPRGLDRLKKRKAGAVAR